jgi:NADPH:quinone reductase
MAEERAALIYAFGEEPRVESTPQPQRAAGQTLVAVAAGSLNPADLMMAKGYLPGGLPPLPLRVGLEGAGYVVSSDTYAEGTRVWFQTIGAFATHAVAPDDRIAPLPDGIRIEHAAGLGIAGIAALVGLEGAARLRPSESVLVLGASGNVGRLGVQVARLIGASRVVAAGRHQESLEQARALGAHETVLLGDEADWVSALKASSGPSGFDVVLDPVWGRVASAAAQAMAPRGRMITVGASAPATFGPEVRAGALEIIGFDGGRWPAATWVDTVQRLAAWVVAGRLEVDSESIPLAEVASAYQLQEKNPRRKLVLIP